MDGMDGFGIPAFNDNGHQYVLLERVGSGSGALTAQAAGSKRRAMSAPVCRGSVLGSNYDTSAKELQEISMTRAAPTWLVPIAAIFILQTIAAFLSRFIPIIAPAV